MKKTFKLVALLIALVMVFAVVLAACDKGCGEGNHKDENHDGVCDVCGQEGLTVTHTGGTATCQKKAVCSVCGKEYGELGSHVGGTATCQAKAKCSVCGQEYGTLGNHVDEDGNGFCDVCGKVVLTDAYGTTLAIWDSSKALGYEDEKVYTMVDYTSGTQSLNWNPHTWEENLDSTVMSLINVGFFDFVLDSTGTAYSIVPELATYVPGTTVEGAPFTGNLYRDVTSQYVGRFGVKEGESSKAFRIYLNPNATWDDAKHTKITAQSYIYSMQQQLNPDMQNRRADSYYGGDFSIVGAKSYLNQGAGWFAAEEVYEEFSAELASLLVWKMGPSLEGQGKKAAAMAGLRAAYNSGYESYGMNSTQSAGDYLVALSTAFNAPVSVTAEQINALENKTVAEILADSALKATFDYLIEWWDEGDDGILAFTIAEHDNGVFSWDNVGLIAGKDSVSGLEYLDMIIENPLRTPEFYVALYNSSTWLVHEELYEANKVYHYEDGTTTTGKVDTSKGTPISTTSIYCTSVSNSVGYGPYSLVSYELDKEIRFERNESWYGYSDGLHKGQYQMDNYVITVIANHASALLAFEKGEVDSIGLDSDDMAKYSGSSRISTTPQTYTTKISFVTDYTALAKRQGNGINKTILTVKDFREAVSLSISRDKFVQTLTAGADAGFGLLNRMYVHDVVGGVAYRDTDAGKKAIVNLYGLEYGAGKDYATLDDAYKAVTGYDPDRAAQLWASAVQYATTHDRNGKVVAQGSADAIYNGTDRIEIQFDVYNSDDIYTKMVNFFQEAVAATTKGTVLEGKVSFHLVPNADYYDTVATGETDVIFSTWGGAQFNGLSTISNCYTDDPWGKGNQMEYGFDTSKLPLTITLDLDGSLNFRTFTSSVKNWADWLANRNEEQIVDENGNALPVGTSLNLDVLQEVFAEVEREYLAQFVAIPIYYRNSVALDSYKVESAISEYVNLVGYGGLRFTTFNYDDASWKTFCSNPDNLDYTK